MTTPLHLFGPGLHLHHHLPQLHLLVTFQRYKQRDVRLLVLIVDTFTVNTSVVVTAHHRKIVEFLAFFSSTESMLKAFISLCKLPTFLRPSFRQLVRIKCKFSSTPDSFALIKSKLYLPNCITILATCFASCTYLTVSQSWLLALEFVCFVSTSSPTLS